ncbi:DoxX family protein [Olivibacter ginsenosidimutans]|uniref:DoxX family protein n=1 Tax=Olivibacter ginsenosidimutans TaxID=1176537 RepID=A0ABP9AIH1_9SPHI
MKMKIIRTLQTDSDWAGLVSRLSIGIVFFPHGAQKLLGWWGGYGFSGTMDFFTNAMNLPWLIAFMVIAIEFFGALSLIAGFATRLWSALTIILCIGVVFSSHLEHGFFMNWFGNQQGEGYEFFILMIGLCIVSLINGGGKYSADNIIVKMQ